MNNSEDKIAELLKQGGDERLLEGESTAFNKYGCLTKPYPHLSFSSCTASTISYDTFEHVCEYYNKISNKNYDISEHFQLVRDELRAILGLGDTVDVALAASGTDLEILPFLITKNKRITNILVGPDEVGTGASLICNGNYYSQIAPNREKVWRGSRINGLERHDIETIGVPVRNPDGTPRTSSDVECDLRCSIQEAIEGDRSLIIHCLFKSKTGLIAPSPEGFKSIVRQYPEATYVVDACQFRNSKEIVRDFLENNCIVFLTGSKFFRAPPFCACALIPPDLRQNFVDVPDVPCGLSHLIGREELPLRWTGFNGKLQYNENLGLLLRWKAAIHEMRNFFAIDQERVTSSVNIFLKVIRELISETEELEILQVARANILSPIEDALSSTIVTLMFSDTSISHGFSKYIYRQLFLNTEPIQCHTGQPVKVMRDGDKWRGTLRIALSSRYFIDHSGKVEPEQEAILRGEIATLLSKIIGEKNRYQLSI